MPAAPLFRRGDTVYLKNTSAVGRLDSFKVRNSRFLDGKWVYQIQIAKKPPHQQTIGDGFDKRIPEFDIFYFEDELTTLCGAIDLGIDEIQRQIATLETKQTELCAGSTTPALNPDPDGPKFSLDEEVFLDVSARLGFFMSARVTGIFEVGVQPGSIKTKYVYTTNLRPVSSSETLFYREDEFITECEVFPKVLLNLNAQLANLITKRSEFCSGI